MASKDSICFKAAESLKLDQRKANCQELIASSLANIAKESEFLELSHSEMSSVIQSAQEKKADPDDALQATFTWISHQLDERINGIEELLQKIQLTNCSIEALETEMNTHEEILDQCPEVYKILNNSLTEIVKHGGRRTKRKTRKNPNSSTIVAVGDSNVTCWEINSLFEFVELCTMPENRKFSSVCQYEDGFVVSGGYDSVSCIMFVLSTKAWTTLPSLCSTRGRHASIIFHGRLFVFGGCVSGKRSNSVESLQIDGGAWDKEPDAPAALWYPEVACVDTIIFLLGTWNNYQLYQLNTETQVWSINKQMPGKGQRIDRGARMASVKGQLFVAGGKNTFAQYNPATNSWCTGNPPALRHFFGALVLHQQKLYLMGGSSEDRVEEYDINTKSWSLSDFKLPTSSCLSVY